MAYAIQYQSQFDSLVEERYRIEILGKDYGGVVRPFTCAGIPVTHSWSEDDPKAPVKGSSLAVKIINDGSLPIGSFYSIDDTQYKVRFWWENILAQNGTTDINTSTSGTLGIVELTLTSVTPAVQAGAKTITFAGNTYNVVSVTFAGSSTIVTINTPLPTATITAAPYTINYELDQLLFEGFLVQDDFLEDMVDFAHELTLSANDGLGLLKDVPLNQFAPSQIIATGIADITTTAPHGITLSSTAVAAIVGDTMTITGTTFDGAYTIEQVLPGSGFTSYVITQSITTNATQTGTVTVTRLFNFDIKLSLLSIIQCCINATNIALPVNVYSNLIEQSESYSMPFLEQTLIATSTFLKDETNYQDCYTVLSNIMQRFDMVIFQALGQWQIIKWDELRYYNKAIPYFKYDSIFKTVNSNISTVAIINTATSVTPGQSIIVVPDSAGLTFNIGDYINLSSLPAGNGTYLIIGVEASSPNHVITVFGTIPDNISQTATVQVIGKFTFAQSFTEGINEPIIPKYTVTQRPVRPFKYDKETFNYKQPVNLLKNADFKKLGPLLRAYSTGTGIDTLYISEYEMPDWTMGVGPRAATPFIRVTKDYLDNEISRVGVASGGGLNTGPGAAPTVSQMIASSPIEVSKGDVIDFNFTFKTILDSTGQTVFTNFVMILSDGFTTIQASKAVEYFGQEDTEIDFSPIFFGSTTNSIPFNGILTIYLENLNYGPDSPGAGDIYPNTETIYSNLSIDIKFFVNKSTKVIGQTHESFQQANIKNKEDLEIFIDTSPRGSISGTLFVNSSIGLLQNKANKFIRKPGDPAKNLGEIITKEQLFYRRITRTQVEGGFYGIIENDKHISMLSVLTFTALPGLNFIFGKLDIDYRNNAFNGTQYELYNNIETDGDLVSDYDFEYIYKTN